MKPKRNSVEKQVPKRDVFEGLKEGMEALAAARAGKVTLRTHAIEAKPAPTLSPEE